MFNKIRPLAGAAVLALMAPLASWASPTTTINFNDLAAAITTSDGVLLSNQYTVSSGVTFSQIPGTAGVIRAYSAAATPGSITAPCDADPATNLAACPNTNAGDGFAGGNNFMLTIDSGLEFNLMTLSITGLQRGGITVVVNGSETDPNTGFSFVPTTLAPAGSTSWTWIASQDLLTAASDIGVIRSVEFNGSAIIDNITLSFVGTTPPPPNGVPEPASAALALLALGGIGLSRRRRA